MSMSVQIRAALAGLVRDALPAGATVAEDRLAPFARSDCPAANVRIPARQHELEGLDEPLVYRVTASAEVVILAQPPAGGEQFDAANDADAHAEAVLTMLHTGSNPTLGGLLDQPLTVTSVEAGASDVNATLAARVIALELVYTTSYGS